MCLEPPVVHPAGPVIKGRSVSGRTTETPFRVRDFGPERTDMDVPIKGFGRGAGVFCAETYVRICYNIHNSTMRRKNIHIKAVKDTG